MLGRVVKWSRDSGIAMVTGWREQGYCRELGGGGWSCLCDAGSGDKLRCSPGVKSACIERIAIGYDGGV